VSLAAKLANQFGFFVYPDSYYYLLLATNFVSSGRSGGTLGVGGMPFPPPGYAAMKATYPIATAGAMALGLGVEAAGRAVTVGAAVLSVAVAYWAVRRLLESRPAGILAAAFTALSYGLTYWAGFVLSDSLSILLAFVLLGMLARSREDEWSNRGDVASGLVLALLLLSRPTYFVALPLLLLLAVRRFGWTTKRLTTAGVSCLFAVSAVAVVFFPPAAFSASVLVRLLPVLGAALAIGALAVVGIDRMGRRVLGDGAGIDEAAGAAIMSAPAAKGLLALACVVPGAVLLQWALSTTGLADPFPGLANFAARDAAVLVALVPGAFALVRARRLDTAAILLVSAVVLLGVYWWVEPRESRYLTHILPFLVPVASAVALLLRPSKARGTAAAASLTGAPGPSVRVRVVSVAVASAIAVALLGQGFLSFGRRLPEFLKTNYPLEVSSRVRPYVRADDTLLTAIPWPYHFYLGRPAWGAAVALSDRYLDYLPAGTALLVLEDAPMRFHYPELAEALAQTLDAYEVARFDVPTQYQYGYTGIADPAPVVLYRLTAGQLESAVRRAGVPLRTGAPSQQADEPK
jgi:hypothetical protein